MQYTCLALWKHPRKFTIAELSIRKLGSSSVLIILVHCPNIGACASLVHRALFEQIEANLLLFVLLALMKIRACGSKALQ